MKFSWVTIHVRDFKESFQFYHEYLDLPLVSRVDTEEFTMAMLGTPGEPLVELITTGKTQKTPVAAENNAVGIGIFVRDVEEKLEELRQAGFPQLGEIVAPSPQYLFGFVKDPNGNTVQLVQEQ